MSTNVRVQSVRTPYDPQFLRGAHKFTLSRLFRYHNPVLPLPMQLLLPLNKLAWQVASQLSMAVCVVVVASQNRSISLLLSFLFNRRVRLFSQLRVAVLPLLLALTIDCRLLALGLIYSAGSR
jgi:hypothetical protein